MLKIYDTSRTFLRELSNHKDLSVTEELSNGDETLEFTYRGKPSDIQNEMYVESGDQRYVVKETRPGDHDTSYVCKLDLEALEAKMFLQFTSTNHTAAETAALALAGTGWTVSSSMIKKRSVQQYKKMPYEILLKIRDAFMCEIRFDSINQVVYLEEEFGEDKGVYFRRELNLKKADLTLDSYDYYTRIVPIGKDGLTIEDVNGGKDYVENYQYSDKVRTLIWEDSSYEDPQALKEDAEGKLADLSKPKRSYSADVRDLSRISGKYDILAFALGDTVTIVDEPSGIYEKQRIVKLKRYPDNPNKNTVELSNTILTWEELQDRMDAAAAAWETISNADGTVNGVYVHGVQVGDVVGIEAEVNRNIDSSKTVADIKSDVSSLQTTTQGLTDDITAVNARIGSIETNYIKAETADLKYATIENLNATNATVHSIQSDYGAFKDLTAENFAAVSGRFDNIETNYLKAEMANIDIANLNKAKIMEMFTEIGMIKQAAISEGHITGYLDAVKIDAANITTGILDASIIEVTNLNADNINVGTINGQRIANGAIDPTKLTQQLSDTIDGAVANTQVLYALSDSSSIAPDETQWSESAPDWQEGKYMWQKTILTHSDGTVTTKPATCISGAQGASGEDATILRLDSSRGTVFKNSTFSTVLTVVIWKGPKQITDLSALREEYGITAYLEWKWKRPEDDDFKTISASDPRISNDGFRFEVTPDDVSEKIVFQCDLQI